MPNSGGLVRSELRLLFGRLRTRVLLVVLALIPVLLGLAVRASSSKPQPGEGPPFLDRVTGNGLFVVIVGLGVALPFFLPLVVGVVAGDALAGEANLGTLRYLLVLPTGRVRLLAAKYASVLVFCLAAALTIAAFGLLTGAALFHLGPVTLLSGDTISLVAAIGRATLIALYVAAMMAGLGAIGLFVSTMTDTPVGAMATTVGLAVVSQIVDNVPQVSQVHPYLFTHDWQAFTGLLRQPVVTGDIGHGLALQAAYIAVFWALAWARFTTKDVLA